MMVLKKYLELKCFSRTSYMNEIDSIFDGMEDVIDRSKYEVIDEMRTMNLRDQREVVSYWRGMRSFVSDLLGWTRDFFGSAHDLIKRGVEIATRPIRSVFSMAKDWFLNLFD